MEALKYTKSRYLNHLISSPFIYSVFLGFIILDILTEIYHRICFPLYGLEIIDRKKYIKFDRHKLHYLTSFQKLNCMYCEYGNGLINYVREIAGETEKYWCGIQHEKDPNFIAPNHHNNFVPYGDEVAFYKAYGEYDECKLTLKRD